ncbi:hypothetical protein [Collimonas humicola]|uniref:hypothetical protein n=1 Tax=Collimonas humicola TaxID=2825886 RepID=UPI001B8B7418|nr:hypothetical protein [Collimonas humicola]
MKKNDVPENGLEELQVNKTAGRQVEDAHRPRKIMELLSKQMPSQSPTMKAIAANAKKLAECTQPIRELQARLKPLAELRQFAKPDIPAMKILSALDLRKDLDLPKNLADSMIAIERLSVLTSILAPGDSAATLLRDKTKLFYEENCQFFLATRLIDAIEVHDSETIDQLMQDPDFCNMTLVELVRIQKQSSEDKEAELAQLTRELEALQIEARGLDDKMGKIKDGFKAGASYADKQIFNQWVVASNIVVRNLPELMAVFRDAELPLQKTYTEQTIKGWYKKIMPTVALSNGRPKNN